MPSKKNKNKQKNGNKMPAMALVEGQGGYYSDRVVPFMRKIVPDGTFSKTGSFAGGIVGKAKAGAAGGVVGSKIGGFLGGQLSRILGFGKYTVSSNTIMKEGYALSEGTEVPSFRVTGHETRVYHREYVADILVPASPTTFTLSAYTINAANSALFPWLAQISASFQQYRFNGLMIEFKTLSSDITSGGSLGAVIMATNYDVNDSNFSSKLAMENSEYAISAKPSVCQMHAVECDPKLVASNMYYCRDSTQNLTSTSDNRLYDLGTFQLATVGLPGSSGQVLGELWVTYDVSLFKPELASPSSASLSTKITGAGSVSRTSLFGTTPTYAGGVATASGNTITFLSTGSYLVGIQVIGTVFAVPTLSGTCTVSALESTGPVPGTITQWAILYKVTTTAAGQTFILDFSSSTTLTASIAEIARCDTSNLS